MSAKLMGMVFDLLLSPDEQAIMLCLADHAEDDGSRIYPGVERLAWKSGRSERTVQRVLRRLEEAGLIRKVNDGRGGRGHATEYHMDITKGVPKPPFISKKGDTLTPFETAKGVRVTPITTVKGDIRTPFSTSKGDGVTPITAVKGDRTVSPIDEERVTETTIKGDRAVSPQPSVEPPDSTVGSLRASENLRAVPKPSRASDPIWDALVAEIGHGPATKSERGAWNHAVSQLREVEATPEQVHERCRRYRVEWPRVKLTPTAIVRHWSEFATQQTTEYQPPAWTGWRD